MATVYLNTNARFKCPCGYAVFFKPVRGDSGVAVHGGGVLLDDCELRLVGPVRPGQCPFTINPATNSPPGPCESPRLGGQWQGTGNISVSGRHPLSSKSFIQCPKLTAIKPFPPTYRTLTVDNGVSQITVRLTAAEPGASGGGGAQAQRRGSGQNAGAPSPAPAAAAQPPFSAASAAGAAPPVPAADACGRPETFSDAYALCAMNQGDACENCAYLKTSHELKEENESKNAADLKANLTAPPFLDDYIKASGAIETLRLETGLEDLAGLDKIYSTAHHHLIPVNQCFKGHKSLVKLANYYGYDINGALNGICLPSAASGCRKLPAEKQRGIAFHAMEKLKLQWHVGPHQTTIPAAAAARLARPFRSYKTEVDDMLDQFVSRNFQKTGCRAKSFEQKAGKFRSDMDAVCARIRARLLRFGGNPRDPACIYVSKMSFYYAFYNELKEFQDILFRKTETEEVTDDERVVLWDRGGV